MKNEIQVMEREARSKKVNKRKETDTRRADNCGRAVKGVGGTLESWVRKPLKIYIFVFVFLCYTVLMK